MKNKLATIKYLPNNFKIIEQIANSWDLTGVSKGSVGISKPSGGERYTGCRAGELKKK